MQVEEPNSNMSNRLNAYELHQFLEYHRKPDEILYAVVDAAKDYPLAIASRDLLGEPMRPLFSNVPYFMERVGPYVARIPCCDRYPEYMKMWVERLGDSAGIFLLSSAWPKTVRSHLRSIFKVYDEEKRMFYFRFYDPRVLRTYLPTCTIKECREFFGPVRMFFAESPDPAFMQSFQVGQSAIHLEEDEIQPFVQTLDHTDQGAPV